MSALALSPSLLLTLSDRRSKLSESGSPRDPRDLRSNLPDGTRDPVEESMGIYHCLALLPDSAFHTTGV